MEWKTNFSKLPLGVPVLVCTIHNQYMAGDFGVRSNLEIFFEDSSGAWCIELDELKKYVKID